MQAQRDLAYSMPSGDRPPLAPAPRSLPPLKIHESFQWPGDGASVTHMLFGSRPVRGIVVKGLWPPTATAETTKACPQRRKREECPLLSQKGFTHAHTPSQHNSRQPLSTQLTSSSHK